jgi:hypothetical protein
MNTQELPWMRNRFVNDDGTVTHKDLLGRIPDAIDVIEETDEFLERITEKRIVHRASGPPPINWPNWKHGGNHA